jgi:hypothetical protein
MNRILLSDFTVPKRLINCNSSTCLIQNAGTPAVRTLHLQGNTKICRSNRIPRHTRENSIIPRGFLPQTFLANAVVTHSDVRGNPDGAARE